MKSANRLTNEIKKAAIFKTVNLYGKTELQANRELWDNFGSFFEDPKFRSGYGHWLWKPLIIMDLMIRINEGDGILYLDAGSHLNFANQAARSTFNQYLTTAQEKRSIVFEVNSGARERDYSHPSLLRAMKLSEHDCNTPQLEAGAIFLIKDQKSQDFLKEWLHWCTRENFLFLLNQDYSIDGKEHRGRYDQSIMSCLYKSMNMYVGDGKTYFHPHWTRDGGSYPIWHTRQRSGRKILKSQPTLLMRSIFDHIRDFTRYRLQKR